MCIWTHPGGMWTDAHNQVWQMQIASVEPNKYKKAAPTERLFSFYMVFTQKGRKKLICLPEAVPAKQRGCVAKMRTGISNHQRKNRSSEWFFLYYIVFTKKRNSNDPIRRKRESLPMGMAILPHFCEECVFSGGNPGFSKGRYRKNLTFCPNYGRNYR